MDDQGWNRHPSQRGSQIEVAEASPDALLNAANNAEGGEIARALGVGKVPRDAQFERTLPVCRRIELPKPRGGELRAQSLNSRALLTPRKLRLEPLAELARHGGGIDERH